MKLRGLIGMRYQFPLYIKTRWGIHTWFMKRPIVVAVIDNSGIVRHKKRLLPWSVFFWNPLYFQVIEFDEDDSRSTDIDIGSKLTIVVQETL